MRTLHRVHLQHQFRDDQKFSLLPPSNQYYLCWRAHSPLPVPDYCCSDFTIMFTSFISTSIIRLREGDAHNVSLITTTLSTRLFLRRRRRLLLLSSPGHASSSSSHSSLPLGNLFPMIIVGYIVAAYY